MIDTINLFFAYAYADEPLRNALEKHLSTLKRQGIITAWHDLKILPGCEWKQETMVHLRTAHIILLLVSPDFLASDYAYGVEFKQAMERHQRGEAIVIPIIMRPIDWKHDPLDKLQVLPLGGKPVTSWLNQDEGLLSVAEGIRKVVEDLRKTSRIPLAKKKEQDSWEGPLQKASVDMLTDQKEQGIKQPQQILKLTNAQQASQSKYHIQIDSSKGTVIGDQARVTQTFKEKG